MLEPSSLRRAARRGPGPDRPDRLGLRGNSLSASSAHAPRARARSRSTAEADCRRPTSTPRAAIERGFALLPADRQGASGVDSLPIVDNMFLPDVAASSAAAACATARWSARRATLARAFEVRPNDPSLKLSALSGGNAQKVLIARWMNRVALAAAARRADAGRRCRHPPADLCGAAQGGGRTACRSSAPVPRPSSSPRSATASWSSPRAGSAREITGDELDQGRHFRGLLRFRACGTRPTQPVVLTRRERDA